MHAGAFRVEEPRVEHRSFSCRGTVNNDSPKLSQALHAFRHMLTTKHFEDGIDTFPAGQVFDRFLVVLLLVVDTVLQSEFTHLCQLFIRRRCSIYLDTENFSDLNCRCSHTARNSVNQDACAGGFVDQSCLPIGEIGGEEINREGCCLLRSPTLRNWPQERSAGRGLFGECSPLRVAHHALARLPVNTSKLAACDQGWLRRAVISSARGENVCEIQAASLDVDDNLFRTGMGFGRILHFEHFGAAKARNHECFHAASLPYRIVLRPRGWSIYNEEGFRLSRPVVHAVAGERGFYSDEVSPRV